MQPSKALPANVGCSLNPTLALMKRLTIGETLEPGFEVLGQNTVTGYEFADTNGVRAALRLFEAKKVSEVDSEAASSSGLTPML